jgi:hypothetical protein
MDVVFAKRSQTQIVARLKIGKENVIGLYDISSRLPTGIGLGQIPHHPQSSQQ